MRFELTTALVLLCSVPANSRAQDADPSQWEWLSEKEAARLVAYPDAKRWFIPPSAPGDLLSPVVMDVNCACTTIYFAQIVYPLTACSVPDAFGELAAQTQRDTLGLSKSISYLRAFLGTGRDAAVPGELYCVRHYGPWPATLEAETTCASSHPTFTLLPWSSLIPGATWSDLIENHPPEVMFAQFPVRTDETCASCGGSKECGVLPPPQNP